MKKIIENFFDSYHFLLLFIVTNNEQSPNLRLGHVDTYIKNYFKIRLDFFIFKKKTYDKIPNT